MGQRKNLSPRRKSNPWPPVHRSGALTTKLLGDSSRARSYLFLKTDRISQSRAGSENLAVTVTYKSKPLRSYTLTAVFLIRIITTVIVTVTSPCSWYTAAIVTAELRRATCKTCSYKEKSSSPMGQLLIDG